MVKSSSISANNLIATKLNGLCGGHIKADQWELEKEKFLELGEAVTLYIEDLLKRKKGY
jgi:hypothetical protein